MRFPARYPRDLVAFGSVHFGKSLLWAGEDALVLFLLVRVLNVEPMLAGMAFLVSSLWNALGDGVVGSLLERRPRAPGLLRWSAWGAIGTAAIGFALLPFLPSGNAGAAIALLMLFRAGYCLADVPHNALTRVIVGPGEHLRIARVRAIGSSAAALTVALFCMPLLASGGARDVAAWAAAAIALAGLVLMAPLPALLARHADSLRATPPEPAPATRAGRGNLRLWVFALSSMIGFAGLAATGKALLHVDLSASGLGAAALLLITAGRLGAIWIWSPIARRIGNAAAYRLAFAACAGAALLLPPLIGAGSAGIVLLFAAYGLAGGGVALLCWAMLSETIDAARAERGSAGDAFAFSLFTMTTKIGLGLSALFVGIWLTLDGHGTAGIDPAALWPLSLGVVATSAVATLLPRLVDYRRPRPFAQSAATELQR